MSVTNETYVPLSRGILEHFPSLPPLSFKIYVFLLIKADFIGKNKGKYKIPISDIAAFMDVHYQTVRKCIKKDLENKFITLSPGKNQYCSTVFTILKYKTVQDFIQSALSLQAQSTPICPEPTSSKQVSQRDSERVSKQVSQQTQELQQNHTDTATQELKNLRTKELKQDLKDICAFWNSQNIIQHKNSKEIDTAITSALKPYTAEEIIEAITNYSEILNHPEIYWLTYHWTLIVFLTQKRKNSIETFLNINNPLKRYKIQYRKTKREINLEQSRKELLKLEQEERSKE